ncbi:hypothetical protein ACROYT_G018468 [Oculina patagonica]
MDITLMQMQELPGKILFTTCEKLNTAPEAGIDTTAFSRHSARPATTSYRARSGLTVKTFAAAMEDTQDTRSLPAVIIHTVILAATTLLSLTAMQLKQNKDMINNSRTRAASEEAQRQYDEMNQEVLRDIWREKGKYIDERTGKRKRSSSRETQDKIFL